MRETETAWDTLTQRLHQAEESRVAAERNAALARAQHAELALAFANRRIDRLRALAGRLRYELTGRRHWGRT